MQSVPAFPDILKIADFRGKNTDVSKTHRRVSRDLCIFWVFFN